MTGDLCRVPPACHGVIAGIFSNRELDKQKDVWLDGLLFSTELNNRNIRGFGVVFNNYGSILIIYLNDALQLLG